MSRKDDHCHAIKSKDALTECIVERLGNDSLVDLVAPFVSDLSPAFLVRLPYGREIVQGGQLQSPCQPASRCSSCSQLIKSAQNASLTIPLSLVLKQAVEVFLPIESAGLEHAPSRPMRLLSPGEFFGVFETLDAQTGSPPTTPPWGVTAGARSVTVLTSEMSEKMKKTLSRELHDSALRGQSSALMHAMRRDGWELVRHLVRGSPTTGSPEWIAELLIFTGATARALQSHPAGARALLNVAMIGWVQSRDLRGGLIQEERLAQNQHLNRAGISSADRLALGGVLRQVVAIARGDLPGYSPVTSESIVPIHLLRTRLSALAGPSKGGRAAILMGPHTLRRGGDVVFVSMSFNCLPAQTRDVKRPDTDWNGFCDHVEHSLAAIDDLPLSESGYVAEKEAISMLTAIAGEFAIPGKKTIPTTLPFFRGCFRLVRGD